MRTSAAAVSKTVHVGCLPRFSCFGRLQHSAFHCGLSIKLSKTVPVIVCLSAPVGQPTVCGCGMSVPFKLMPNASVARVCAAAGKTMHSVTHAQQNSVIVVKSAGGEDTFVWTGDRWQSACRATLQAQGFAGKRLGPDLGCVKAHDYQYWAPLQWDERATPPVPRQLVWLDQFELAVAA